MNQNIETIEMNSKLASEVTDQEVCDFFIAWMIAAGIVVLFSVFFLFKKNEK